MKSKFYFSSITFNIYINDSRTCFSISRYKPSGAAIVTPNTIFLTDKRVIIRNPTRLSFRENIEEYFYHQITNIRLEKGMLSTSLIFTIPRMTEISKSSRKMAMWGRDSDGVIDAIPKKIAEQMYEFIRKKIEDEKKKKITSKNTVTNDADLLDIFKKRYVKGEITTKQYNEMKNNL